MPQEHLVDPERRGPHVRQQPSDSSARRGGGDSPGQSRVHGGAHALTTPSMRYAHMRSTLDTLREMRRFSRPDALTKSTLSYPNF